MPSDFKACRDHAGGFVFSEWLPPDKVREDETWNGISDQQVLKEHSLSLCIPSPKSFQKNGFIFQAER